MTARLLLAILSFLFLLSADSFSGYATVFLYHRFDDPRYPSTSVSLEDFEKQMEYLKNHHYKVVTVLELIHMMKKGYIPPKTAVITIDDGYKSTMKAFKILKKFKFPFTVFLYTKAVGSYRDFLTKSDIETLKKSGLVTFGNHSYSHFRLSKLKGFKEDQFEDFLKEDLKKSEERFRKLVGYTPKIYAYPYGEYSRLFVKILRKRGYIAAFSQDPGSVGVHSFRYFIPRRAIVGSWSSLSHFKKVLSISPLPVREFSPDIGFCSRRVKIKAKIEDGSYKRCKIYITEIGWLNAFRKQGFVFLKKEISLKSTEGERIGLFCEDKTGTPSEFFWFIIPDW